MIRLLSTWQGARRAWAGPILRIREAGRSTFLVGLSGAGVVSAMNRDAPARDDGSVRVLDLMAGDLKPSAPADATDLRQGVTPTAHAVLDAIDDFRRVLMPLPFEALLKQGAEAAGASRSGPLDERRRSAVTAAAFLILAAELIDEDLRG